MLRKGFTLIELMITIAIMGILAGAAMMQFGTYLNNKDLETESYKLNSFIGKYKVESYKTEEPLFFKVEGSANLGKSTFSVYRKKSDNTYELVESYDVDKNREMTISNSPKATGVYMVADDAITAKYVEVNPFSLGIRIDGAETAVVRLKHKNLGDKEYTITFFDKQARVVLAREGKEL